MALVSASLFSGAGGLDLGFEAVGVEACVYVERDAACRATLAANRPRTPCLDDVCGLSGARLLRAARKRSIDVLVGGPPCQSFSTIGRRRGMEDVRGRLILEYLRLLGELLPNFFVFENVTGILSATRNGTPLMPWLRGAFSRLGYRVGVWKLDATEFGVAQKRERVIVLGSRLGGVCRPEASPAATRLVLRDVIGDLVDTPGECGKFPPKLARVLATIPEGGNWKSLPPGVREEAMGRADIRSGGLVGFYRRLSFDRPSPTLLASPMHRATTLCHPSCLRPLSIEEYRRIQGFPASWQLCGSVAQKYKQLGNAVPVVLAAAIAAAVVRLSRATPTSRHVGSVRRRARRTAETTELWGTSCPSS